MTAILYNTPFTGFIAGSPGFTASEVFARAGTLPPVTGGGVIPRGGWALGSTRVSLPGGNSAATATSLYQIGETAMGMPSWSGPLRLILSAAIFANGVQTPLANSLSFDWLTVRRGSTFFPVTLNGQTSFTLGPNDVVFSDPVAGFTTVPLEVISVRHELNTPNTTRFPVMGNVVLGGSDLPEGRLSGTITSPRPDLRTAGTIPAIAASNAQTWSPSGAVVGGYDGSSRVALIFGDSRDVPPNDFVARAVNRGALGGVGRGLEDPTGGRIAYGNFSVRGARATTFPTAFPALWDLLATLPNQAFHDVWTSINGNDINALTGAVSSLAEMQAADLAMWEFLRAKGAQRIYHCFGEPWTSDPSGKFFSTVADQVPAAASTPPNGLLQQTNNSLAARAGGMPAYVIPMDMRSVLQDAGTPGVWPVPSVTGTLVSASSRTQVVDFAAPLPQDFGGDCLVTTPGVLGTVLTITLITNVGNRYTFTTDGPVSGTHIAGDLVTFSYTKDGVHQGATLCKLEAGLINAAKQSGIVQTTA